MDLQRYARVLWRFRFLVVGGFVVAVALTILAVARVNFTGGSIKLTYRKPEIWQSQASLLITQRGFPWGSLAGTSNAQNFANLVGLYVKFVNSDAVQSQLRLTADEGVHGQTVVDSSLYGSTAALPVLGIVGMASSPGKAQQLADSATAVFKRYIDRQQQAAGIPQGQRIVLQEINVASPALLIQGHKKTLPILAFMTVMIATLGLAFVLENLRPQPVRRLSPQEDREQEPLQRSA